MANWIDEFPDGSKSILEFGSATAAARRTDYDALGNVTKYCVYEPSADPAFATWSAFTADGRLLNRWELSGHPNEVQVLRRFGPNGDLEMVVHDFDPWDCGPS